MNREQIIFHDIVTLKQKIIELFILEYGDIPSNDELIKFASLDKMQNKSVRLRNHFLQRATYIYNNYSNKEIIDYILTLGQLTISNYPIAKYCDDESLLILVNVYNEILICDYDQYHKVMDKKIIMLPLQEKINSIVNNEGLARRKVVTRNISSQFVKKCEQLLHDQVELSDILSILPREIASFMCIGHKLDLEESITDVSLITNKR